MYVCMYICMYVCMVCMSVCIFLCLNVRVCILIYTVSTIKTSIPNYAATRICVDTISARGIVETRTTEAVVSDFKNTQHCLKLCKYFTNYTDGKDVNLNVYLLIKTV